MNVQPRLDETTDGSRLWTRLADEQGYVLPTVIGLISVLTITAVVALTFALNASRPARDHQDWNAALAAAEAGLDDYLARLNRDTAYWSTATPQDPLGNDALGEDTWAQLPGSDAFYSYTVDSSRATSEGTVVVTSTGRVNGEVRTVEASFRPAGFLDYVYFTDLETLAPDLDPSCIQEYWVDRTNRNCLAIRFVTNDVIDGPLRTNDRIQIDGNPQFLGPVETWRYVSPSTGEYWHDFGSGSNPSFVSGIEGPEITKLDLPSTNAALIDRTGPTEGGCRYYGPTYIKFEGTEMVVRSPLSVSPPDGNPLPNPNCFEGNVASLASTSGARVDLEDPSFNGVLYVDEGDPSLCGPSSHPLGLPLSGEAADPDEYICWEADAFAWGELDGQVTLAARRDIKIIWDLTYAGDFDTGTDLIGLIADQDIKVWHPVSAWAAFGQPRPSANNRPISSNNSGTTIPPHPPGLHPTNMDSSRTWTDPEIHAAIVALNGTFTVQSFHLGPRFDASDGLLTVRGAIAQKYRGPVGLSGTNPSGYFKDYRYDYRLRYLSPPYFIAPDDSEWIRRTWAELRNPADLPDT